MQVQFFQQRLFQKSATKITYGDGTVQEGWKLTLIGSLQANSNTLTDLTSVNIADDGSGTTEGYYLPWELKGVVAFVDLTLNQNVINVLQNGAELGDTASAAGRASDSMAILEKFSRFCSRLYIICSCKSKWRWFICYRYNYSTF